MAKKRRPGPLDALRGTGMSCAHEEHDPHRWSLMDAIAYKFERAWSSVTNANDPPSESSLAKYKNEWVTFHKRTIVALSDAYKFPPEILGGIAWTEVGGDPDFVDKAAYVVRRFDHSADPWLEPMTITKRPELTSAGDVSIQIRNAAKALGFSGKLTSQQSQKIMELLECESANLAIVARHVSDILHFYYPQYSPQGVDDQAIMVVGYAYNMGYPHDQIGPTKDLSKITISNYGHDLLKKREAIRELLGL